jgi:uncharacterized protein (DUF924 family)
MRIALAEDLLACWFGSALESHEAARERVGLWFRQDAAFDRELAERFRDLPERGRGGELDVWAEEPRHALARVIALDQLPRNLYRDSPQTHAFDAAALAAAIDALARGHDRVLHPLEAMFLYLPFEHAEDLAMQERSVRLFEALRQRAPPGLEPLFAGFADFARRHHAVVARFGRFPHRNEILGRASTAAEKAYLANGGERFGARARSRRTTSPARRAPASD